MSLDPLSIATGGLIGGGPIGVALDGFVTSDEVIVAIRSTCFRVALIGAAAYASHMIAVCYAETSSFVTGFDGLDSYASAFESEDSERTLFDVLEVEVSSYVVAIEDC